MATASSIAASIASKTKTKKKHFVAQKVKLFRASDPLLSVLMWGVNHSINELSHVQIPIMLMPDDFKAYSKIKVDNHLFNKENMPSHFKFKEYCPLVFRNLRERFGIDDQDFQNSLTRAAPLNSDSQGRSGARFHTSYDKRYVIKTITSEDVAEMHNILKKYHQFIVECHGNTLLPQFLGMYRLTVDGDETYMIVTRNVFSHRLSVYKKYDLKGSTVAREASDKEKQPRPPEDAPPRPKSNVQQRLQTLRIATRFYCAMKHVRDAKELPTYKDNDFINDGQKIYIDDDNKKMFLEKLRKDVEFLAQLKLMDYSLLVGIHDVERAEQEEVESEDNEGDDEGESDGGIGTPPDSPSNTLDSTKPLSPGEFDPTIDVYAIKSNDSAPRKEVYFMAVIDILQHYDAKKKAAHAAKTVKHGAGAEISTVNPEQYSKRFYDFITTILS
ncbi:phosphatidylinositol 5-phosphate 4-kinase type-2 alpha isoform 1-T1 [Salvelinus alpinus]|uniref:Phosphatidylinositol 5-phosphate 4-kinase type-2 alpha n=7 Tax=Salmoninae TaxID=504568 RepID=A0A8C7L5K9_ONCKI|nr:phosphatidylinositol 5-phosphate 4-kinase type-2 alpha isoform X1 [Oncorhynchus kisutch]XP_023856372.1 phosphatidylinositol 5-phosphate 4-kinase type-2 alpha isoform X1 [Salvelinus alpinus]XP_024230306.1 phosphatidylinositol 5-phosphate 4-kinase type-2 alpha isoform X1 [Oncorhynchus tshawytscha]XP_029552293.1 phosphatidylinositol 5-phosphate 4-kinase type-2 alpha isoform X1 [Salmo trutta]XP_035597708.1 phosphatidylinositol 5-phosphate 4-kinase type-2 alpha isoform X1 [Oncorhynchus keta]XP_0|eukprot:XP_014012596.1 PREDICTED: phosphatidylinositol 5-phosphate 4-kinase type-2 alpha isoform X1 [Salmo salar]